MVTLAFLLASSDACLFVSSLRMICRLLVIANATIAIALRARDRCALLMPVTFHIPPEGMVFVADGPECAYTLA